jgi:hypothetical protein
MRDGAPDVRTLLRKVLPMSEADVRNLCEERSLAGKCGNPLCCLPYRPAREPHKSAHIDWVTLEMVKIKKNDFWCSSNCHMRCEKLARSLGTAADRLDVLRTLQQPVPGTE